MNLSSEGGNSYASYLVGLMHENGEGTEQNFNKAVTYYQRSSEQGNSHGMNRIALCYNYGYGVEVNYSKAMEY